MAHIINPKTEKLFPTACEFLARIETFPNDIAYTAQCKHCGGKMGGHIKYSGAGLLKEKQVNDLVLRTVARRHECKHKQAQWSDKSLLNKIAPDIMIGMDELKEQAERNKRSGRA